MLAASGFQRKLKGQRAMRDEHLPVSKESGGTCFSQKVNIRVYPEDVGHMVPNRLWVEDTNSSN